MITQVDQQVAKKRLSLKVTNCTLRCDSETSLRRPERSQRRLRGNVINTSHQRRLRDLQIALFEMSLRLCMRSLRDASEMHPCQLGLV